MEIIKVLDIYKTVLKMLRDKSDELDFMFDTANGFEKWLQGEVALAFKDELLPFVYNSNWVEITSQGEAVSEIKREFKPDWDRPEIIDLYVVEKPFLKKYTHNDPSKGCINQLKDDNSKNNVISEFDKSKFHYIELKILRSNFSSHGSLDLSLIKYDMDKLEQIISHKLNLASSLIVMGVVRLFYKKEDFDIDQGKEFILKRLKEFDLKHWKYKIEEISEQDFFLFLYREY